MRLFGREAEICAFDQILHDCALGRSAFALVSGESGIGKTALLAEVAASAEACGFRVIAEANAHSRQPATGSSLIDLIRGFLQAGQSASSGAELQLNGSRFNANGHYKRAGQSVSTVESAPGMPQNLRGLLVEAAQSRPLLILLDDLRGFGANWPQPLTCLAELLRDFPILILAACRSSAAPGACQAIIEAAAGRARSFELEPLSRRATEELIESQLSRPVSARLLEWLWELTGGNPGLIAESGPLISADPEITDLRTAPITIPLGVRLAVEERLAGLAPRARHLLRCASAFDSAFEPELAAGLADTDLGDAWAALVQLRDGKLVASGDGHQYRFSHGFVREVLYQSIPHEVRSSMHRRIAMALEGRHINDLASYAGLIARHLLLSRETSALAGAIKYARMAGERLMQSSEFARASEILELAFERARDGGYEDDIGFCEVLTDCGVAQKMAGPLAAADETFRRAIKYARRIASSQCLTRLALEVPDYHWPLPGANSPLAILLIENALQLLGETESKARALLTARLSAELSYDMTQKRRAEELAMLAFEIAAQAGQQQ